MLTINIRWCHLCDNASFDDECGICDDNGMEKLGEVKIETPSGRVVESSVKISIYNTEQRRVVTCVLGNIIPYIFERYDMGNGLMIYCNGDVRKYGFRIYRIEKDSEFDIMKTTNMNILDVFNMVKWNLNQNEILTKDLFEAYKNSLISR
jgi:hypothetical protein